VCTFFKHLHRHPGALRCKRKYREPTRSWMVTRVVAPPSHESLNLGFNTLVSHKGIIFFSGRRRSGRQRDAYGDFVNLKTCRIRFLTQSLGGAHRGRVCVRAFIRVNACVTVFDCNVFRKKTEIPRDLNTKSGTAEL
jgi:hypothetical protein